MKKSETYIYGKKAKNGTFENTIGIRRTIRLRKDLTELLQEHYRFSVEEIKEQLDFVVATFQVLREQTK